MSRIIIDPIQLIVHWDVDGVLVNSEPQHVAKLISVCNKYGVRLSAEDFLQRHAFAVPDGAGGMKDVVMQLHGAGDKNIYYWLLSKKPELAATLSKEQWLNELLAHYIANKHKLKPRGQIARVVNDLATFGAIQGVVTSGIPGQVEANMHALGAAKNHLSFILTASDVTKPKPDPEGWLIAKERAQDIMRKRGQTSDVLHVGVEDSPEVGVPSLFAAGMSVVHFVLPKHKAATPPEGKEDTFRVAKTAPEVYTKIVDLWYKAMTARGAMRRHLEQQRLFLRGMQP